MARLPIPGSDQGEWGEILNDYLSVAHNEDGSLKPVVIPAGSITPVMLSQSYLQTTQKSAPNGVASLDEYGKVSSVQLPDPIVIPDAASNEKGVIQLAGDLSGTADAPTVPGLATKAATSTNVTAGAGLVGGGDLSADRSLAVNFGTTAGTVAAGDDSRIIGAEQVSNRGAANGYASLDSAGKVPTAQMAIGSRVQPFSSGGPLTVEVGGHRLYNDTAAPWTILSVRASVGAPPTGGSLIVDVNVDGVTIFTVQANRPVIAASGYTSGKLTNMNITTIANGAYLTIDVDQVGSTTPGADLVVQVEVV